MGTKLSRRASSSSLAGAQTGAPAPSTAASIPGARGNVIDRIADGETEVYSRSCRNSGLATTSSRTRCGCGPSGRPAVEHVRKMRLKEAALEYREMLERLRMAQAEQRRAQAGSLSMSEMVDLSSKLGLCKDGLKDVVHMCGELSENCPPQDEERRKAILAVQAEACFSLGEVYECPQTPGASSIARLAVLSYESAAELFREIDNAAAERKALERVLQLCVHAAAGAGGVYGGQGAPSAAGGDGGGGRGGSGGRDLRRALRGARRLLELAPDSDAARDNVAVIEQEAQAGEDEAVDLQCSMQITAHGRELVVSRALAF